jgi:hypothetical protein
MLLDPPKGMRTYVLKPDRQCAAAAAAERVKLRGLHRHMLAAAGESVERLDERDREEAERDKARQGLRVQGTLTVKVKVSKSKGKSKSKRDKGAGKEEGEDKDKGAHDIRCWRLEVIRAHNLPIVDPYETTSAYCEILWKVRPLTQI